MTATPAGQALAISNARPVPASRPGMRPAGPNGTRPAGNWTASARTMPRGVSQASFATALAQATQARQPDQAMQGLFQNLPNLNMGAAAPASGVLTVPNGHGGVIMQAANKYGVDPALIAAVMETESGFNADAVSRAGARGLMQLMPGTARGLGVTDATDPLQAALGGAKLLGQLLNKYDGNVEFALAAYNAGSGAVDKYGGIPPYAETRSYVPKVMAAYEKFRRPAPAARPVQTITIPGTDPGVPMTPATQATGRTTGR